MRAEPAIGDVRLRRWTQQNARFDIGWIREYLRPSHRYLSRLRHNARRKSAVKFRAQKHHQAAKRRDSRERQDLRKPAARNLWITLSKNEDSPSRSLLPKIIAQKGEAESDRATRRTFSRVPNTQEREAADTSGISNQWPKVRIDKKRNHGSIRRGARRRNSRTAQPRSDRSSYSLPDSHDRITQL
jgi:hypothetical protein